MIKVLTGILASLVLALAALTSIVSTENARPVFGSVAVHSAYFSTTTSASNLITTPIADSLTGTTTHSGTFGSIIVTGAGTAGGNLDFYDATTTNIAQRAASMATSTIFLGSIPTASAVGTYTFDTVFLRGIIMVNSGAGSVGTTTVTWRND